MVVLQEVTNIKLWEKVYRSNVEQEFWQILQFGVIYSEVSYKDFIQESSNSIHTQADICDHLFPETLLLGLICSIDSVTEDDPTVDNIFDYIKEDNGYYPTLIKNNKDLFDLVRKYYGRKHDLIDSICELRKYNANAFARKLEQLLADAKKDSRIITVEEIFNFALNKFGKPDDVIDKSERQGMMSGERFVWLREQIGKKILGQDNAISKFIEGLFVGQLTSGEKKGPMSAYLFVGPPGVGKTYLARTAGKLLDRPFKTYQMNEYANRDSFHGLVGFEKTWKDSRPGTLTKYVKENPNAILLFDEFEKAHINTLRQFLSVLDGGFLKDLYYDEDIDFTGTICIFTTNAGRDFYEENRDRSISTLSESTLIDAIKKERNEVGEPSIPTEILSRLAKGNIIGFDHIQPVRLLNVIKKGLKKGTSEYKEKMGIEIRYDETILSHLFMFHLGNKLDARVAAERSRSFIINIGHSVIEYESQEKNALKKISGQAEDSDNCETSWADKSIQIDIDDNDPIVKKYLKQERKSQFIIIAKTENVAEIENGGNEERPFETFDWFSKNDDQKRENIRRILDENNIDAILIDPYFAFSNDQSDTFEGVLNIRSRAIPLLKWILEQEDAPPVYVLYTSRHKELRYNQEDRNALTSMGVKGFIEADYNSVKELSQEVFLSERLNNLASKGRALDFDPDYKDKDPEYYVVLRNFAERVSMDADASNVSVNETPGAIEDSFDKVIGAENAKQELKRFVKFLRNPKRYLRSGQSVSKGIVLYGPPGTGKTMLARALASAADCPFIAVSGADIIPEQIGPRSTGESVRDIAGLFRLARKYAPSVLFIDEIDAFGKPRLLNNDNNTKIINKLLTEMDGFVSHRDKPVFVIAATNAATAPGIRGNNILLDDALLRRFTRKVYVDLPNEEERLKYLEMQKKELAGKKYGLDGFTDEQLKEFSRLTAYYSLASIKNAIEIAQGIAADEEHDTLTYEVLRDAYEESVYGEKIKNLEDHIKTTAYHEAGHAFMSFQADERFWPEFATVIGRGDYLGLVRHREDKGHGLTKEQLLSNVRIALAGRAAEIVFNGDEAGLSAGARNDLEQATESVWELLCKFGMEDGRLMSVPGEMDEILKSPMAQEYTSRVNEILAEQLKITVDCIRTNKDKVQKLGDELLRKSRLSMEEMCTILGIPDPSDR